MGEKEHICGFCKHQSYVGAKEGYVCLCERSPKHLGRVYSEDHCNEWRAKSLVVVTHSPDVEDYGIDC